MLHCMETAQARCSKAVAVACCSDVYLNIHTYSFGLKLHFFHKNSDFALFLKEANVLKLNVTQI